MPFSTPFDLQQLMGLMCAFNVVLPWDFTSFGETFHTKEIALDSPKESPNLQGWEMSR